MAKPTEARKAELKAWTYKFFNEVWDRKFTPKSDVQSGLIKYLIRDNISDEELKTFSDATKAWVKYYRDAAKQGSGGVAPATAGLVRGCRRERNRFIA